MLVEKVTGYWESVLAIELARILGNFVSRRKLGTLAGEAGMLRLSPGLVRIPDLSFISGGGSAHYRHARAPILPLAPDLAIEAQAKAIRLGRWAERSEGQAAQQAWFNPNLDAL